MPHKKATTQPAYKSYPEQHLDPASRRYACVRCGVEKTAHWLVDSPCGKYCRGGCGGQAKVKLLPAMNRLSYLQQMELCVTHARETVERHRITELLPRQAESIDACLADYVMGALDAMELALIRKGK